MWKTVSSALLLSFVIICSAQNLPKEIETCSRSESNVNECLKRTIEGALRTLKNGNQQFDIPPIDPFRIHRAESESAGGTSNFNLRSSLIDSTLSGFSTAKLNRIATRFDKKLGIKADALVKLLAIEGNYIMTGKLILPINGQGKCNLTFSDVQVLINMRGDYFDRDGLTYANITRFTIKLNPKRAHYYFENIFRNDAKLSDNINRLMNDQTDLVNSIILPGYEGKFGEMFIDIANKFFHHIPVNRIFRD